MYIRPYRNGFRCEVQIGAARKTKTFKSEREARRWGRDMEAELAAKAQPGGRTFGDLADEYVKRITLHKRSANWEANAVRRLREQVGENVALADIDQAAIAKWRDERMQVVTGSTIQREANLLRNMLRVAVDEWRWLNEHPMRGVRMPKHNPPRTAMWTWPLIRRVLRAPRTGKTAEMQRAFRIALHTGMRLNEVLTHQYDPRSGVVTLPSSKSSGAPVRMPVPRRARKLLPAGPFTVGANEGSTLFSKLCRELLIEGLTFHDSRAFALTMYSRRMDIMTLARISRHRDLSLLQNTYYREDAADIAARV